MQVCIAQPVVRRLHQPAGWLAAGVVVLWGCSVSEIPGRDPPPHHPSCSTRWHGDGGGVLCAAAPCGVRWY